LPVGRFTQGDKEWEGGHCKGINRGEDVKKARGNQIGEKLCNNGRKKNGSPEKLK